jgi:transposase-like protein
MHPSNWTKYVRVVGRSQSPRGWEKGSCHEAPKKFCIELKRKIIEELLSGVSTPAQLIRRYEITSGLLYHWKEQYARGRFNNEPSKEAALEDLGRCPDSASLFHPRSVQS